MTRFEQVLALIAEHGGQTARDVAATLGIPVPYARGLMSKMHNGKLPAGKLVYISAWRRESDGGRLYPRPVYQAGHHRDTPGPGALTNTEYNRRHRQRQRGSVNSVFNLAGNNAKRRVLVDWRTVAA